MCGSLELSFEIYRISALILAGDYINSWNDFASSTLPHSHFHCITQLEFPLLYQTVLPACFSVCQVAGGSRIAVKTNKWWLSLASETFRNSRLSYGEAVMGCWDANTPHPFSFPSWFLRTIHLVLLLSSGFG